jgi:hypothetical protein
MSARDLKIILGYVVLFGSVVLGLGYETTLKHRVQEALSASDGGASSAPPVSSSDIRPVVNRIRR